MASCATDQGMPLDLRVVTGLETLSTGAKIGVAARVVAKLFLAEHLAGLDILALVIALVGDRIDPFDTEHFFGGAGGLRQQPEIAAGVGHLLRNAPEAPATKVFVRFHTVCLVFESQSGVPKLFICGNSWSQAGRAPQLPLLQASSGSVGDSVSWNMAPRIGGKQGMATIGFIGLGNMGAPMAANLVKAGHQVTGYDIVPAAVAALAAKGGRAAASAAEAVAAGEIVITMLPAGPQVCEVYLGNGGVLGRARKDALLIDCSTIDVETARAVAAAASEAGFDMLDGPVSGGTAGADAATLTIMVGGSAEGFARAQPILAAMGRTIVHAGPAGSGQAVKICNNMLLAISMIGVCEAFTLADRLGLAAQTLFDVVAKSSGQCWALTSYCPVPGPVPSSPANRDYAPGFTAAMMLKDLRLAQQAAGAAAAPTPLGAAAAALYQLHVDQGAGALDFSAIYRFIDKPDHKI